jgi:hypothetical protein
MTEVSNRAVAKALRASGRSVVVGTPKWNDMSNFWVIGDTGVTHVVNIQTHSILGLGCHRHPDYTKTRDALMAEAKELLTNAGIAFEVSTTCPNDQLFLSGYKARG